MRRRSEEKMRPGYGATHVLQVQHGAAGRCGLALKSWSAPGPWSPARHPPHLLLRLLLQLPLHLLLLCSLELLQSLHLKGTPLSHLLHLPPSCLHLLFSSSHLSPPLLSLFLSWVFLASSPRGFILQLLENVCDS